MATVTTEQPAIVASFVFPARRDLDVDRVRTARSSTTSTALPHFFLFLHHPLVPLFISVPLLLLIVGSLEPDELVCIEHIGLVVEADEAVMTPSIDLLRSHFEYIHKRVEIFSGEVVNIDVLVLGSLGDDHLIVVIVFVGGCLALLTLLLGFTLGLLLGLLVLRVRVFLGFPTHCDLHTFAPVAAIVVRTSAMATTAIFIIVHSRFAVPSSPRLYIMISNDTLDDLCMHTVVIVVKSPMRHRF